MLHVGYRPLIQPTYCLLLSNSFKKGLRTGFEVTRVACWHVKNHTNGHQTQVPHRNQSEVCMLVHWVNRQEEEWTERRSAMPKRHCTTELVLWLLPIETMSALIFFTFTWRVIVSFLEHSFNSFVICFAFWNYFVTFGTSCLQVYLKPCVRSSFC